MEFGTAPSEQDIQANLISLEDLRLDLRDLSIDAIQRKKRELEEANLELLRENELLQKFATVYKVEDKTNEEELFKDESREHYIERLRGRGKRKIELQTLSSFLKCDVAMQVQAIRNKERALEKHQNELMVAEKIVR